MEEDIKILEELKYQIGIKVKKIGKETDNPIFMQMYEDYIKQIQAIEHLIQAYKKDEAVIDSMAEFMNKRSWKEHQLKDKDCNCCKTEYSSDECVSCIEGYFREKVKDEVK